jgi:putative ATP-dependent endonuclease of OLD family
MRIKSIRVKNYRTFNDITIYLNNKLSYIVGDNGLGKSNFLELLDTIFNTKPFVQSDFQDPTKEINVLIEFYVSHRETDDINKKISHFSDFFVPFETDKKENNNNILTFHVSQNIKWSYQHFKLVKIKNNEMHEAGLKLDDMNYILSKCHIVRYMTKSSKYDDNLDSEAGSINLNINNIASIKSNQIPKEIKRIVANESNISNGKNMLFNAPTSEQARLKLSIYNTIINSIITRKNNFRYNLDITAYGDDPKTLPLIITIDEPEKHLNPFLHRCLIHYVLDILENKDEVFTHVLQNLFAAEHIEKIVGQVLIVTHSNDGILSNYENIIKLYKNHSTKNIEAISGNNIRFSDTNYKHYIMHFPEISEALFARSGIIIEGETEFGIFPLFAKRLGIDLDENGIILINARGQGSIKEIRNVLRAFRIPSVGVYDSDVRNFLQEQNKSTATDKDLFFTNEKCFEPEIVQEFIKNDELDFLQEILSIIIKNVAGREFHKPDIINAMKEIGIQYEFDSIDDFSEYTHTLHEKYIFNQIFEQKDKYLIKAVVSRLLKGKKGVITGATFGDYMLFKQNNAKDYLIPECYLEALKRAKTLSE